MAFSSRSASIVAISPADAASCAAWVGTAPALVAAGADTLLLRVLDAAPDVRGWIDALTATGARLIVHVRTPGGAEEALRRGLDVHLPEGADAAAWRPRVAGALGQSAHDLAGLARAARAGCDHALLSPVFPPMSKPDDARAPLGLDGLRTLCAAVDLPILALGGIGPGRARPCVAAGARGVAGIGAFAEPATVAALRRELVGRA